VANAKEKKETTLNQNDPVSIELEEQLGGEDATEGQNEKGNEQSEQDAQESVVAEIAESQVDPIVAERDKLKDQLLRTAADFDNFRKRTRRDIEDVKIRSQEDILRQLLPIVDNLKRAIAASEEAQNPETVIEGVQMVLKLFEDTGERLGLKRINAVGERFDPALHDALQQIETPDQPTGTIIAEITPGYLFRGHLLRASLVVVARSPKKKEEKEKMNSSQEPSPGDSSDSSSPDSKSSL